MKKVFFSLALGMSVMALFGQNDLPTYGFFYQAIIRDAAGQPLSANQELLLRATILDDTDSAVYKETHIATTDQFGKIALVIGSGIAEFGKFDTLNWSVRKHFLEVTVKLTGMTGFTSLGKQEIILQPFAKSNGDWINKGDTLLLSDKKVEISHRDLNLYESTFRLWHYNPSAGPALQIWKHSSFAYPNQTAFEVVGGVTDISPKKFWIGTADGDPYKLRGIFDGQLKISEDLQVDSWNAHNIELQSDRKRISIPADPDGRVIFYTHTYQISPAWQFRDLLDNDLKAEISGINGNVWSKGTGSFAMVEVRGNDRAHLLNTTTGQSIPAHTVTVFDNTHPSTIRPCNKAYDQKTAGVISDTSQTAKYHVGIIHAQENTKNGSPVAIDGTVEVLAVGPIKVGDFLTTSNIEGYAMRAKNRRKAYGAVLGKAVSPLAKGEKGIVEMWVERH